MAITYKETKLSPTRRDGQLINLTKTTISGGSGGVSSYNNLTDIPATFTPSIHNNSAHAEYYVNTNELAAAVAGLVDSSPAALNTLNELAAALGDDPNFATTVTNQIGLKASTASPTFTGIPSFTTTGGEILSVGTAGTGMDNYVRFVGTANSFDIGVRSDGSFGIADAGVAYRVVMTQSGNVGIGTTAPANKCTIYNTSGTAYIDIATPVGQGVGVNFRPYQSESQWSNPPQACILALDDNSYSANLYFQTKTPGALSNALTTKMILTSSGNVLIGQTSGSEKLCVTGNIVATGDIIAYHS